MALTDNLMAFYEFESGSLLVDQVNGLTLTNSANPVTSVSGGIVGNGASFTAASSMQLSRASDAKLQAGPALSISAWIKPIGVAATFPGVVDKGSSGSTGQDCYAFYINNASISFRAVDSSGTQADALASGALSAGVFAFIIGTYDPADKKSRIYVNNGAENVSSVLTAGINTSGTANFVIGHYGLSTWYFDGVIDQVGLWQRVLTSGERTSLYNSGNGLSYAQMQSLGLILSPWQSRGAMGALVVQ